MGLPTGLILRIIPISYLYIGVDYFKLYQTAV